VNSGTLVWWNNDSAITWTSLVYTNLFKADHSRPLILDRIQFLTRFESNENTCLSLYAERKARNHLVTFIYRLWYDAVGKFTTSRSKAERITTEPPQRKSAFHMTYLKKFLYLKVIYLSRKQLHGRQITRRWYLSSKQASQSNLFYKYN